jgi:hypothetical protein
LNTREIWQKETNYGQYFPFYAFGGMFLSVALLGIFPALNAMRVYQGKSPWKYPLKINFFK